MSNQTTEPVTLEQKDILHILRNPWGKTGDEIRRARLEGADEIERLQRSYDRAHEQAMENGTRALQAQHERDCAVEDVARLEYIQRDFHNVGDVAEIKRLRTAIGHYVRTKKADLGENVHYWWTLQEIAKESSGDVPDIAFIGGKAGTAGEHEPECGCPVCDTSNRGDR